MIADTRKLDEILTKIRQAKAGKGTSGLEHQYGEAYQALVRQGTRPQLKAKYRG